MPRKKSASGSKSASKVIEEEEWTVINEQVVHVDIHGLYQDDILRHITKSGEESVAFQLTGLKSDAPILQIGKQEFAGTYSDSPDTSVFFRCSSSSSSNSSRSPGEEDQVFCQSVAASRLSAELDCTTKKRLTFQRVFLKPKS